MNPYTAPIVVCSEPYALRALSDHPDWALLSIRNNGLSPLNVKAVWEPRPSGLLAPGEREEAPHLTGPRLDLCFDDVDNYHGSNGAFSPPTDEHADKIVGFARRLLDNPPPGLIVHCSAGTSRSTAAVLGVLEVLDPGANPVTGLELFRRTSIDLDYRDADHPAAPNPRLTALLDIRLGCDWKLFTPIYNYYWFARAKDDRTAEFYRVDAHS